MSYSLAELKPGLKIEFRGKPFQVIEARHSKMARSMGQAQVKIKNLISGEIINHSFAGNQTIEPAEVNFRKFQFLYESAGQLFFMDPQNFEQISIKPSEKKKWLKPSQEVDLIFWEERAIGFSLPTKISLKVKEADPGLRGDRQTAGLKKITLETGAYINAPLFIKPGDKIIVNTDTGEYVKRN